MWLDGHRTALYRFWDANGALLYVGITANLDSRWDDHERLKPWWPQVDRKTVQWFDTRPEARAAELAAIRTERPIHNVDGSPSAPGPRTLDVGEATVAEFRAKLGEHWQRVHYGGEVVVIVDRTKARKRVAALVSMDFYERALAALGETSVLADMPTT